MLITTIIASLTFHHAPLHFLSLMPSTGMTHHAIDLHAMTVIMLYAIALRCCSSRRMIMHDQSGVTHTICVFSASGQRGMRQGIAVTQPASHRSCASQNPVMEHDTRRFAARAGGAVSGFQALCREDLISGWSYSSLLYRARLFSG
jgi:hypothetical protein